MKRTHGESRYPARTPEYNSWLMMRNRCLNSKDERFPDWGGRGIKVCARWNSFENFLADMGRRPSSKHTLDRIDNDSDYGPKNCRWATVTQQNKNGRHNKLSDDKVAEIRWLAWIKKLTYTAIAQRFGISITHARRIALGEQWEDFQN